MSSARIQALVAIAVIAIPATSYATGVTFDFAGVVTNGTGIYGTAPVGSAVTGTFTIDMAAGIATQSQMPVSFVSPWFIQAYGGPDVSAAYPLPDALVFSSTLRGAGVTYSTPVVGGAGVSSHVGGVGSSDLFSIDEIPTSFQACETHLYGSAGVNTASYFEIDGRHPPFAADGLPVFAGQVSGFGEIISNGPGGTSVLRYQVTSVPEPSTLSVLALGVIASAFARRRRTK